MVGFPFANRQEDTPVLLGHHPWGRGVWQSGWNLPAHHWSFQSEKARELSPGSTVRGRRGGRSTVRPSRGFSPAPHPRLSGVELGIRGTGSHLFCFLLVRAHLSSAPCSVCCINVFSEEVMCAAKDPNSKFRLPVSGTAGKQHAGHFSCSKSPPLHEPQFPPLETGDNTLSQAP